MCHAENPLNYRNIKNKFVSTLYESSPIIFKLLLYGMIARLYKI